MKKELVITLVPVGLVEFMWPQARPILQKAVSLTDREVSTDTIKSDLLYGDRTMVVVLDESKIVAVHLLRVFTFPTGLKVLEIPTISGSRMKEWAVRFLELCHAIAREQNCTELRGFSARKGWGKYLKEFGWENHFMVMRCDTKTRQTNIKQIKG